MRTLADIACIALPTAPISSPRARWPAAHRAIHPPVRRFTCRHSPSASSIRVRTILRAYAGAFAPAAEEAYSVHKPVAARHASGVIPSTLRTTNFQAIPIFGSFIYDGPMFQRIKQNRLALILKDLGATGSGRHRGPIGAAFGKRQASNISELNVTRSITGNIAPSKTVCYYQAGKKIKASHLLNCQTRNKFPTRSERN